LSIVGFIGLFRRDKANEPDCHHAIVIWKWEVDENGGEPSGPVWVDYYADENTVGKSVKWEQWATRSTAEEFARAHGYEFLADE
jgi:hypothetical protein